MTLTSCSVSYVNFREGWCKLRYPNKEVEASLQQFLLAAYRNVLPAEVLSPVLKLRTAFRQNDVDEVIRIINSNLASIPYDLWRGATELHYHALVHLTFSLLGFYIQSEVHTAGGRCDSMVKTDTHIYVFEFKLDEPAEIALQQISNKNYLAAYQDDHRQKIAIGISFSSENKKIDEYKILEA